MSEKKGREITWGSGNEIIQFAHANAYVPECYHKFLNAIQSKDYTFVLPELRPLWPESRPEAFNSWHILADDLIQMMDAAGRQNVTGMGHSMGAIATLLASIKRPDLFRQIILIDPVILPAKVGIINRLVPFSLKKKYITFVKIASNRRNRWPDVKSIESHLGEKKVFKRFDHDVWVDFLKYAFVVDDNFLKLRYPREWEARIYATAPNLWPMMRKSKVPMTIIKAEFSDVITAATWTKLGKKLPKAHLIEMEKTGHLIPFEKPIELAQVVRNLLNKKISG